MRHASIKNSGKYSKDHLHEGVIDSSSIGGQGVSVGAGGNGGGSPKRQASINKKNKQDVINKIKK